jgi:hypothetical protein
LPVPVMIVAWIPAWASVACRLVAMLMKGGSVSERMVT